LDLAELRNIYQLCRNKPEVRLKRELWARLLAAAFGNQFADDDELFIQHTYLVLTAEVIAHAAMKIDLLGRPLTARDLVSARTLRDYEISGVVEEDFFGWPVDSTQGEVFVESLARRLARFDWTQVDHDVLKVLYESVIDPQTRHQLAEYYTRDWLARRMVNEVVDDPLHQCLG
jgi:hypothetical protein